MTMTKKSITREELAYIQKVFFKGAGLDEARLLKGEERRAYRLSQVERLLAEKPRSSTMAVLLSDEFWSADEGRSQYEASSPLLSLKEQQTLTDREMDRLRLIVEIAGLCHDLSLHFTFSLKEFFGIRKSDFRVSNKGLVKWLTTTAYERIAMHTAYIMKKEAIGVYVNRHYLPAQDQLAELAAEDGTWIDMPESTEIPARDYVRIILDELLQIERHWQHGRRLKLRPDLVILHDEIYGVVPCRFDKGVLQAAQALYDYMDKKVQGRLVGQDKNVRSEVLWHFADKVREVRTRYLSKGWVEDNSLEFNYLMSHAERCGKGWWNEEDDAL